MSAEIGSTLDTRDITIAPKSTGLDSGLVNNDQQLLTKATACIESYDYIVETGVVSAEGSSQTGGSQVSPQCSLQAQINARMLASSQQKQEPGIEGQLDQSYQYGKNLQDIADMNKDETFLLDQINSQDISYELSQTQQAVSPSGSVQLSRLNSINLTLDNSSSLSQQQALQTQEERKASHSRFMHPSPIDTTRILGTKSESQSPVFSPWGQSETGVAQHYKEYDWSKVREEDTTFGQSELTATARGSGTNPFNQIVSPIRRRPEPTVAEFKLQPQRIPSSECLPRPPISIPALCPPLTGLDINIEDCNPVCSDLVPNPMHKFPNDRKLRLLHYRPANTHMWQLQNQPDLDSIDNLEQYLWMTQSKIHSHGEIEEVETKRDIQVVREREGGAAVARTIGRIRRAVTLDMHWEGIRQGDDDLGKSVMEVNGTVDENKQEKKQIISEQQQQEPALISNPSQQQKSAREKPIMALDRVKALKSSLLRTQTLGQQPPPQQVSPFQLKLHKLQTLYSEDQAQSMTQSIMMPGQTRQSHQPHPVLKKYTRKSKNNPEEHQTPRVLAKPVVSDKNVEEILYPLSSRLPVRTPTLQSEMQTMLSARQEPKASTTIQTALRVNPSAQESIKMIDPTHMRVHHRTESDSSHSRNQKLRVLSKSPRKTGLSLITSIPKQRQPVARTQADPQKVEQTVHPKPKVIPNPKLKITLFNRPECCP